MKISPVVAAHAPSAAAARPAIRMATQTTSTPSHSSAPEGPLQTAQDASGEQSTEEATQPLSPQLAALAKQRRALQVKEREIADREKALAERPQDGSYVDKAQLKSNPLKTLLDAGVTYEQLTEAVLADSGSDEVRALKAELDALKTGVDQKFTDRATAERAQAVAAIKSEASKLAFTDERFELVKATNSVADVVRLIEANFDETGDVMDTAEAMELIETELYNESLRIAKLTKVQKGLAPEVLPKQPQGQAPRTLTNRDTASTPLSAKARAIAAFNGHLKK